MRSAFAVSVLLAVATTAGTASAEKIFSIPVVRPAVGPSWITSPLGAHAAFDATAGAAFYFTNARAVIGAEAGYAFQDPTTHAACLMLAAGYGYVLLAGTYQPRLIVGRDEDGTVVGMRNGLMLRSGFDLLGIEVAHQFLRRDGGIGHDVRFMFSVNPLFFVGASQFELR